MNKKLRQLILLVLPALASCGGFSLDYIVEGDKYNSYNFLENYYEHWDDELKNAQEVAQIDVTDARILNFKDIGKVDPNYLTTPKEELPTLREFAKKHCLMGYDQMFYYGVQSKLFDGEAYCDGYYQRHRVQTNPNGFSVRFSKESDELTYLAFQFKSTTNNQLVCYPVGGSSYATNDHQLFHSSTIDLHLSVYTKDNNKIVSHKFSSEITNDGTNDGSNYIFYAFDLTEYELSRMVGFSVTFDIVHDELIEYNKTKGINYIDYALFVYEVLLPYTYWH